MTKRELTSTETDSRYSQQIEYQPVNVFNDSGISEIPASPDHQHQLFDAGTDLTPYLVNGYEMYDSANPARLYRAGNQIIVDGQLKNSDMNDPEDIFNWGGDDDLKALWDAGFTVGSGCVIIETTLDTTFRGAGLRISTGDSAIEIRNVSSGASNALRITINAFTWRTDNEIDSDLPPDSNNVFVWDVTPWDGHVWA